MTDGMTGGELNFFSSRIVGDLRPSEGNPRNSEGDFVRLKDGRIMFAYSRYTGGAHDHSPCDIAAVFSDDNGDSFSDVPRILCSASEHGVANIMSVSLQRMKNGDIGIFYLVKDEKSGTSSYVLRRSTDEGKSFGKPICCLPCTFTGYYVVNNSRVLRTSSGRLLIPAAIHRSGVGDNGMICSEGYGICCIFYSDDDGETWSEAPARLSLGGNTETDTGLQEPGVAELSGGVLYAYFRTDRMYQYESVSLDGGMRWFFPQTSRFTSPASPMKIAQNPYSGEYFSVWNPIPNYNARKSDVDRWVNAGRTPLVMARSRDGLSFCEPQAVENDPKRGFCYPAVFFLDERSLLLSYCSGGVQDGMCLARTTIRKIILTEENDI